MAKRWCGSRRRPTVQPRIPCVVLCRGCVGHLYKHNRTVQHIYMNSVRRKPAMAETTRVPTMRSMVGSPLLSDHPFSYVHGCISCIGDGTCRAPVPKPSKYGMQQAAGCLRHSHAAAVWPLTATHGPRAVSLACAFVAHALALAPPTARSHSVVCSTHRCCDTAGKTLWEFF